MVTWLARIVAVTVSWKTAIFKDGGRSQFYRAEGTDLLVLILHRFKLEESSITNNDCGVSLTFILAYFTQLHHNLTREHLNWAKSLTGTGLYWLYLTEISNKMWLKIKIHSHQKINENQVSKLMLPYLQLSHWHLFDILRLQFVPEPTDIELNQLKPAAGAVCVCVFDCECMY